jgi:hypothetical protein
VHKARRSVLANASRSSAQRCGCSTSLTRSTTPGHGRGALIWSSSTTRRPCRDTGMRTNCLWRIHRPCTTRPEQPSQATASASSAAPTPRANVCSVVSPARALLDSGRRSVARCAAQGALPRR